MGRSTGEADANPLLASGGLPRFDAIAPGHVEPGIRALLETLAAELGALEARLSEGLAPTWESVIEPLERLGDRLGRAWGLVGHLLGVKNSDALRAAHDAVQADVVAFGNRLGQSRRLYDAFVALRDRTPDTGPGAAQPPAGRAPFDPTQRRVLDVLVRDAELAGVHLDGAARERFNAIQQELALLATKFSNHVLDTTRAFALVLRGPDEVEGLPPSARALAAQSARDAGEAGATPDSGPWRISLDAPSLVPFLQHARRRDLRERLYRAYVTRASEGDLDNAPILERMLALRREEAHLLGYPTFADLSLVAKMAPDVDAVKRLLEDLRRASYDAAKGDLDELRELASERGEEAEIAPWDVAYWAERLREERYAFTDEEIRPYFALPRVLDGLFALTERLFGVSIDSADGQAPVWHPDVRFFRVRDTRSGAPLAAFYLDPYSRPAEKRGGAWMDECVGRSRTCAEAGESVRLPVAYLACNQTPPVGDRPSLMTFREVETLFHEFGHGLQHMLTTVDTGLASGIRNVEWDAVELPSQFMENWCYHRPTLLGIARHWETGEPLPEDLFEKLRAARTFRAGSDMLRQLFFATTDLALHSEYEPGGDETAFDVERRVARATTVLPPLPEDRFLCAFAHIFGGGYAAGYFSYKWAEVLSADAFAAFEEAGLDDERAVARAGRRFRETILSLGGSRPAMEVFTAFRGREPTTLALLRHTGLAPEPAAA